MSNMSHHDDPIPRWLPGTILRCIKAKKHLHLKEGGTYIVQSLPTFDACLDSPAVPVMPLDAPPLGTAWGERWCACWRFEPLL